MHPHLRIDPEDASLKEILEHIMDGVIAFAPSVRLRLPLTDFRTTGIKTVVAPERRRHPFVIPPIRAKGSKASI